jgi:NTE family protein
MKYDYSTGLILSGGAVRGFAHIGILQALNEHHIFPDIISSVSAGSIVSSFYADGYSPGDIRSLFRSKKIFEIIHLASPKQSLFDIRRLKKILDEHLRSKYMQDLQIPLFITATNYNTGKPEYFHSGKLSERIIASSSIPVLFKPQKIGQYYYIDGGITNNFPIEPLLGKCDRLIGAHVSPVGLDGEPQGLSHIALRSFHLSIASALEDKKRKLDLFIEPMALQSYRLLDIKAADEIFEVGYTFANNLLQDLINIE